jgi:hypothetical protein
MLTTCSRSMPWRSPRCDQHRNGSGCRQRDARAQRPEQKPGVDERGGDHDPPNQFVDIGVVQPGRPERKPQQPEAEKGFR